MKKEKQGESLPKKQEEKHTPKETSKQMPVAHHHKTAEHSTA